MQKKFSQLFCFINEYNCSKLRELNKNIQIIYRNYKKKPEISTLISLKNFCKNNNRKLFISNDIKLALKLKVDGVYIPSFNKKLNYVRFSIPKKFKIIGSAHNFNEISIKQKQGCELIFISPLFKVKKSNFFLGTTKFNFLTNKNKQNYIALGGISLKNLSKLNLLNIHGFAGISYFKKKTAPKRGR